MYSASDHERGPQDPCMLAMTAERERKTNTVSQGKVLSRAGSKLSDGAEGNLLGLRLIFTEEVPWKYLTEIGSHVLRSCIESSFPLTTFAAPARLGRPGIPALTCDSAHTAQGLERLN